MEQQWAEPEGYANNETPNVVYRILDPALGTVVTRRTGCALDSVRQRWYLALNFADQGFANAIAAQIQAACAYFFMKDDYVPLAGWVASRATDDEVRARISRLNTGENAREAERTGQRSYPLDELPWQIQRNLIEKIDELKYAWCFELLGEVQQADE